MKLKRKSHVPNKKYLAQKTQFDKFTWNLSQCAKLQTLHMVQIIIELMLHIIIIKLITKQFTGYNQAI